MKLPEKVNLLGINYKIEEVEVVNKNTPCD